MSSNGLCRHNNLGSYCPSCLKGNTMKQMGAYELIPGSGIFIPDSGELAAKAQGAIVGAAATTIAQSKGTQAAVATAAGESIGAKVVTFYKNNPYIAYPATIAAFYLLFLGVKNTKFFKGA